MRALAASYVQEAVPAKPEGEHQDPALGSRLRGGAPKRRRTAAKTDDDGGAKGAAPRSTDPQEHAGASASASAHFQPGKLIEVRALSGRLLSPNTGRHRSGRPCRAMEASCALPERLAQLTLHAA